MCSDYTLGVFNLTLMALLTSVTKRTLITLTLITIITKITFITTMLITIISKITFLTKTTKNNVLNARNEKQYVRAIKNELCNFVT